MRNFITWIVVWVLWLLHIIFPINYANYTKGSRSCLFRLLLTCVLGGCIGFGLSGAIYEVFIA